MFKLLKNNDESESLDITPLIDVVFILLIFFIIASAFAVRGLDMNVPAAKSSRIISGRTVEIRLDEFGNIFAENVALDKEELKYFIQKTSHGFVEFPGQMVLKAHPKAPAESLIYVVDEVKKQSVEKIIIATSDPKDDK